MTRKQVNTTLAKPLGILAGILGFCQGLIWTVFAFICICCYTGAFLDKSGTGSYASIIWELFLDSNRPESKDIIVTPTVFLIFAAIYLALVVFWEICSGTVLWLSIHEQWHLMTKTFGAWAIITALICIEDVVLVALLSKDLISISSQNEKTRVCYGIVIAVVARGFLLWIFNVILVGFMAKYSFFRQYTNKGSINPIINAYENPSSQSPWTSDQSNAWTYSRPFESDLSESHENPIFSPQGFNPLSRGASTNVQQSQNDANFSFGNPQTQENMRVAKIGRSVSPERRSPPIPVAGPSVPTYPYIPDPDYTPPGSPRSGLKSALKTKSNYW